jgi:hypothetical protein
MSRLRLLLVPLAGLALLRSSELVSAPATAGGDGQAAAISQAALAPFRDELLRDAPALCSDLTASAKESIVPTAPAGASCEQAVQSVWATAGAPSLPRAAALALKAHAVRLTVDGSHATGVFSLVTSEQREHARRGAGAVAIVSLGTHRLDFEELAGRWLVSSQARLLPAGGCEVRAVGRCGVGSRDLTFVLGEPVGEPIQASIPTPAAVRHASAREQDEYAAGRAVFAQTGCLACHRLGDQGNRGPGGNLSHVGAHLSAREIERAVLSPTAPMPSFKNLPRKRLRVLLRFLSLLR